jgi:hypothetical protein
MYFVCPYCPYALQVVGDVDIVRELIASNEDFYHKDGGYTCPQCGGSMNCAPLVDST